VVVEEVLELGDDQAEDFARCPYQLEVGVELACAEHAL